MVQNQYSPEPDMPIPTVYQNPYPLVFGERIYDTIDIIILHYQRAAIESGLLAWVASNRRDDISKPLPL